jgi:transcriptional regulator GlxA family with amidase domain
MEDQNLPSRFREQTGTTPLEWPSRSRIRRAQYLLETTGHSADQIALRVGFGSPRSFRDRFKRLVGTSPRAFRRAFQSSPAP